MVIRIKTRGGKDQVLGHGKALLAEMDDDGARFEFMIPTMKTGKAGGNFLLRFRREELIEMAKAAGLTIQA